MKKFLVLLISICTIVCMAACSAGDEPTTSVESNIETSSAETSTTETSDPNKNRCIECGRYSQGHTYCSNCRCMDCEALVKDGSYYCISHSCLVCENHRFEGVFCVKHKDQNEQYK